MKVKNSIFSGVLALLVVFSVSGNAHAQNQDKVDLTVPHIWEIPDGLWVRPWNGACEEASIAMVERYYLKGPHIVSRTESKALMWPFFAIEDRLFGYHVDTNATETAKLINDYTSFDAVIKKNPSIDDIKKELTAGRPVLSMHYGYDLNNPLHAFRRGGSSYHVMVITGFDDTTQEFLTNDPELKNGRDFRYPYSVFMNSLHDFNQKTKKATGEPVVLFTHAKQLWRAVGGHRIYVVRDGVKQYVSRPSVFVNHRWSWGMVQNVDPSKLDALPNGSVISE